MDKKYQVFISSTFMDLQEERSNVAKALLEMNCIPSGMENFPAVDMEQFEFIKTIIDECDYYILIVAGRYGSISPTGISYTEMEYDYAVSKNIKVIAVVHSDTNSISKANSETTPEIIKKLEEFTTKVKTGRVVKFYKHANEIAGIIALGLTSTIKRYPMPGWVRGDQAASEEILK